MNYPREGGVVAHDPGGQLLVTPAGSTVVSTDALLASADRLRALELALHGDGRRILLADGIVPGWPIDASLSPRIERLRARCESARDAFGRAAEEYTRVEALVEGAQRDLVALLAATLGAPLVALLARLVLFSPGMLMAGALVGWAVLPSTMDALKNFLMDNPEVITNPDFVRFVSLISTSIDAGLLGSAGVPPIVAAALDLGPDGGVAAGSMSLIALGSMLGMFRETSVRVEATGSSTIYAAPQGARERLNEIPEGDQIRIEKYEADGMPPRWVVSVGPTETFSPFADTEPFDQTSNMYGVAGLSAGSFRAVEEAMRQAGIAAGDEIVVAGFSQGGLVATMVAGSGDWNVVGMETYGAPAGNIPLPEGIRGIIVRHTDDLVPALAGPQLDHSVTVIEREAYRDGVEMPDDLPAPGHQRWGYGQTANAIDAADSAAVQQEVHAIDRFTGEYLELPGGQGTSTTYRATRTPDD